MKTTSFSAETLKLDVEKEANRIAEKIRTIVSKDLKRQGLIVAMSGGIDSSTVAGLCVKALGKERVFGLLMPEKHSSDDTLDLSRSVADAYGIKTRYILLVKPIIIATKTLILVSCIIDLKFIDINFF